VRAAAQTPLERVRTHLVGLKMTRALEALDDCVRRVEDGQLSALEFLDELLGEEQATRETRRIKSSLMTARLNRIKTLQGFDFSFQPSLDRNRILALAELRFLERREVVHLLGPPGTGKSHLAIALGVEAVKAGKSVYFATLAEIIESLAKAEREGKLAQRIGFIVRPALLIIDEVGYLPVQPGGANLFFQLINARYERGAVILTSNRGFSEWGEVFGDTVVAAALLDRLLHHAIVIEIAGNSYRLREHAKLVPDNMRLPPISTPEQPKKRRGRPPKTQED
jgi:DNA replication protein DnaC